MRICTNHAAFRFPAIIVVYAICSILVLFAPAHSQGPIVPEKCFSGDGKRINKRYCRQQKPKRQRSTRTWGRSQRRSSGSEETAPKRDKKADNAMAAYEAGLKYEKEKKYDKAIKQYRKWLKYKPSDSTWYRVASLTESTKGKKAALKVLQDAEPHCSRERYDPNYAQYRLYCTVLKRQINALSREIDWDEKWKSERDRALELYEERRYQEAIQIFAALARRYPDWDTAWSYLYHANYSEFLRHVDSVKRGESTEVSKSLQLFVSALDANRRFFLAERKGNAEAHFERLEAAMNFMELRAVCRTKSEACLELNRRLPGVLNGVFRDAAKLSSRDARIGFLHGAVAVRANSPDEANAAVERALGLKRPRSRYLYRYAEVKTRVALQKELAGEVESALEILEQGITRAAGNDDMVKTYADIAMRNGRPEEAFRVSGGFLKNGMTYDQFDYPYGRIDRNGVIGKFAEAGKRIVRDALTSGDIVRAEKVKAEMKDTGKEALSSASVVTALDMLSGADEQAMQTFRDALDDKSSRSRDLSATGYWVTDRSTDFARLISDVAMRKETEGKYGEALDLYERALAESIKGINEKPDFVAWYSKGRVLELMGETEAAGESDRTMFAAAKQKALKEAASAAKHGMKASSVETESAKAESDRVFVTFGDTVSDIGWDGFAGSSVDGEGNYRKDDGSGFEEVDGAELGVRPDIPESAKKDLQYIRNLKRIGDLERIKNQMERRLEEIRSNEAETDKKKQERQMEEYRIKNTLDNAEKTKKVLEKKNERVIEMHKESTTFCISESGECDSGPQT